VCVCVCIIIVYQISAKSLPAGRVTTGLGRKSWLSNACGGEGVKVGSACVYMCFGGFRDYPFIQYAHVRI